MFTKLLTIIFTALFVAASLLVVRQHRLDLAHQASRLHRDSVKREAMLWRLQQEVATRCRPEDVRLALEQTEMQWVPIPCDPDDRPLLHEPPTAVAAGIPADR